MNDNTILVNYICNMKRFKYNVVIILLFSLQLYAQEKVIIADFSVINGDTIFFADIPEVEILAFKDNLERKLYFVLKRKLYLL